MFDFSGALRVLILSSLSNRFLSLDMIRLEVIVAGNKNTDFQNKRLSSV